MSGVTRNEARDRAGVVVTMRRRRDDWPLTVTRAGLTKAALAEALEPFDADEWYLSCVSTPRTILADLTVRKMVLGTVDHARRTGGETSRKQSRTTPEAVLLSAIHRTEFAR